MSKDTISIALGDIGSALRQFSLAWFLAWSDIRQRYVRTLLGPLWIVLSSGIWFGVMGFVMANLFHQDMHDYMPFMVSGLLVWVLISTSLSESTGVLVAAARTIEAFAIPIFTHYLRFILRNYITFLHNLLILVIVFLIYPQPLSPAMLLAVPGMLLDMVILMSLAVFFSMCNLRYRDTHLVVMSALQILPFVTPIFWNREMLQKHFWIADLNPIYHMIQVVRAPLLGQYPEPHSWAIVAVLAVGTFALSCGLFVRFRHRIIFWL